MKSLITAALLLLATACVPPPLLPADHWRPEHPLLGRIWQPAKANFVYKTDFFNELAKTEFLLLGEKHDNPAHHLLQAHIIAEIIYTARKPAVAFEMIDWDQAGALKNQLRNHPRDAKGLGAAVTWQKTGWPKWEMYAPIAEVALDGGLPLVAANFPRRLTRDMTKEGWPGLKPELVSGTGLDQALSKDLAASLNEEIYLSHCKMMPKKHLAPVVRAQRARDAVMAQALFDAAQKANGAVLIAGAGHTRKDRGVPHYLKRLAPGAKIASVAFVEVNEKDGGPPDYAKKFTSKVLPFDFVWFTKRLDNTDPCIKFKKQLQKLKPKI